MQKIEPFIPGAYYHIYNRGINSCNLFEKEENYYYFLNLYERYIEPIADTYAWVLMPNHFHLLLRIREKENNAKPVHQYFSNLFNAYSKAFNKFYERHGALFERPFKRKIIDNPGYYKQLVIYIHQNPVHHGFCAHPIEYGRSSYLTCISSKPTNLKRDEVINWFNCKEGFKEDHKQKLETADLNNWLEI